MRKSCRVERLLNNNNQKKIDNNKTKNMKNKKTILPMLAAGALLLTSLNANANSITLGSSSIVLNGGGSDWTYEYTFANSTLQNGNYFTINDFGAATVVSAPVYPSAGWVFSQALTGPNSLTATDLGTVLNATFTWTGGNNVIVTDALNSFVLHSTANSTAWQFDQYTSIDTSTTSGGTQLSKVIGPIKTPLRVPDGGTTVMLLGSVLSGLALLRRKLAV